jgi:hypothetical protein
MKNEVAKLVKFGNGGDTIYYSKGSTCSGYGTPERPHAAEGKDIPDGTPCIDMREPCARSAGIKLSISGPMVNVDLAPGQVSRAGKITGIFAHAVTSEPGNQFGQLINLHNSLEGKAEYGALDDVAIDIYLALWRAVGARIGNYQDNQPVWQEQTP